MEAREEKERKKERRETKNIFLSSPRLCSSRNFLSFGNVECGIENRNQVKLRWRIIIPNGSDTTAPCCMSRRRRIKEVVSLPFQIAFSVRKFND